MIAVYPHLRSPVSCLFYQFVFKRYIEDDIFTDNELDCIRREIVSAIDRFEQLSPNYGGLGSSSASQAEVVSKPWNTLFYSFIFNTVPKDHDLSSEEIKIIHSGLLELVERYSTIKAYRECQDALSGEEEPEPCSSSSGFDESSDNHNDTDAELAEIQTKAEADKASVNGSATSSSSLLPKQSLGDEFRALTGKGTPSSCTLTLTEKVASPLHSPKELGVEEDDSTKCSLSTIPRPSLRESPYDLKKAPAMQHRPRRQLTEFASPYTGIEVMLSATRTQRCDGKGLNRPLGVTYDEECKQWIVADTENNRIVLVPRGITMTSPQLNAPCAVAVLQPGISFAVLAIRDIQIMYYGKSESDRVIVHSGNARGLAVTSNGNLVTMEKIRGFWQVSVYEGKPNARSVWSCPYPGIQNALPSFLDLYRRTLVVTDLGTQSIVKFSDDDGTDKFRHKRSITLAPDPKNPRQRGTVTYISGVYIDDDMNILVADAKGRSLQVFNNNCIFLYNVKLSGGGFPYISGIWVNNNGQIGVCARGNKDGGLHVYNMRVPVTK
ncbi:unnamed protein product [Cylicocyclus nassatus]|uniref:Uncharacterized protein n=1 Tax=Cylicocyclus nassatus TaxID=53992 RepID=A0AA36M7L8_CYLNA|nr:unnamed protein product [Cylicocyclus nassatus]